MKLRIVEALLARDHAVYRLDSVFASLHQRDTRIVELENEKRELEARVGAYSLTADTTVTDDHETRIERSAAQEREIERLCELTRQLRGEVDALQVRLAAEATAGVAALSIVDAKDTASKVRWTLTDSTWMHLTDGSCQHTQDDDPECVVDVLSPISRQGVLIATEVGISVHTLALAHSSHSNSGICTGRRKAGKHHRLSIRHSRRASFASRHALRHPRSDRYSASILDSRFHKYCCWCELFLCAYMRLHSSTSTIAFSW